jgi:hypothetical protein
METDPVSETLWFPVFLNTGRRTKSKNLIITNKNTTEWLWFSSVQVNHRSIINYVTRHYQPSLLLLKTTVFRRLDSVCVCRWNLLKWAQQEELVFVSEQRQETESSLLNIVVLNKRQDNGYCPELWFILIYHRHKPIDSINLLGS